MTTSQQTALVTGANKGIGFETVRQLAGQGFTVWLGARDQARGEAAAKELGDAGDVRFVRLDVTDDDSVRAAAERVGRETGALDVLVNNAGIGASSGEGLPGSVNWEAVVQVLEVNVHGALRVTQEFLPLVRQAPAGRIVNVSSTLGSLTTITTPGNPLEGVAAFGYAGSKTLLNALTVWTAVELRGTPVLVNSVCPGFNATDMNDGPETAGAQHPSEGAKVVVRAATLPADGPTGSFLDVNGVAPW